MIAVSLPSQLQAYAAGASRVLAKGDTIDEALRDLDAQFPGIRFRIIDEQDRIRRHIRLFVGMEATHDINTRLGDGDALLVFGALSGG